MKRIITAGLLLFMLSVMQVSVYAAPTSKEKKISSAVLKQIKKGKEIKVEIKTTAGSIVIKLYNETPLHRDNFIKLVENGYYSGLLFHRVIPEFMIQGGDPDSKTAEKGQRLGSGGPGYTIPAEIAFPVHFHKRGALAAARTGDQINPQKASSGSQFYIVTGKVLTDQELDQIEKNKSAGGQRALFQKKVDENMELIKKYQSENNNEKLMELQNSIIAEVEKETQSNPSFKFTPVQREKYKATGGTPFLDNEYSVFGEVLEGMNIVDKISAMETDSSDRPKEDVKIISAKILKK